MFGKIYWLLRLQEGKDRVLKNLANVHVVGGHDGPWQGARDRLLLLFDHHKPISQSGHWHLEQFKERINYE